MYLFMKICKLCNYIIAAHRIYIETHTYIHIHRYTYILTHTYMHIHIYT